MSINEVVTLAEKTKADEKNKKVSRSLGRNLYDNRFLNWYRENVIDLWSNTSGQTIFDAVVPLTFLAGRKITLYDGDKMDDKSLTEMYKGPIIIEGTKTLMYAALIAYLIK